MAIYQVEQTIARKRIVQVAADSEEEAREKARDGYGEIIENHRKGELLASRVERVGEAG